MPPHGLSQAIRRLPPQRFLFGSDAGFGEPYWQPYQLQKIRGLALDAASEALILGANAEHILASS